MQPGTGLRALALWGAPVWCHTAPCRRGFGNTAASSASLQDYVVLLLSEVKQEPAAFDFPISCYLDLASLSLSLLHASQQKLSFFLLQSPSAGRRLDPPPPTTLTKPSCLPITQLSVIFLLQLFFSVKTRAPTPPSPPTTTTTAASGTMLHSFFSRLSAT